MDFEKSFEILTKHKPYPWQKDIYKKILEGEIPNILDIPTGLGKTSIMAIWLLAFAESLESKNKVPTRLVYIVDRRVIVDQASKEAEEIYKNLKTADTQILKNLNLNISKMRGGGGMADNREWLSHPNNPAIIIGTIDMIGSRLLFSGYGLGGKIRPFYAGFLGQDSLIILDETHLSPAMESMLKDFKKITMSAKELLFPPKILLMSATQRDTDNTRMTLTEKDRQNKNVNKRYKATKHLKIVKTSDDVQNTIISEAKKLNGRILIYVHSPKDAITINQKLEQESCSTALLTGTMRGFERDKLDQNKAYKSFLSDSYDDSSDKPQFLISTSAGEVGADFDADNMVCDMTTLDSLIQRLGRVNRSGGRTANVIVVYTDTMRNIPKPLKPQAEKTKDLLKNMTKDGKYDASPFNLESENLPFDDDHCSPKPEIQPLTSDILDMWAMTSIYEKSNKPHVKYWLRGNEKTSPDTQVVWREDLKYITMLDGSEIEDVFEKHRILPHEILKDYSKNIYEMLSQRRLDHAFIINKDGMYNVVTKGAIKERDLDFAMVILPTEIGGLNKNGFLDTRSETPVMDVADDKEYEERCRLMVEERDESGKRTKYVIKKFGENLDKKLDETKRSNGKLDELVKNIITKTPHQTKLLSLNNDDGEFHPSGEPGPNKEIHYYIGKKIKYDKKREEKLVDHLNNTKKEAETTLKCFDLKQSIKDAIITAAEFHDDGKREKHWQSCMGIKSIEPLAKTNNRSTSRMGGFRHEFASLVNYESNHKTIKNDEKELIMHLIASHHGWARPCFRTDASIGMKTKPEDKVFFEVMQRYANLQKRFGAYGLAWLEGLMRSSDWRASK